MKTGDYVYYINSEGAHEPGRILKLGKGSKVKVYTDGSGTTKSGEKWVSKSNLIPQ